MTTDKATQCLTISRNVCGPSSESGSSARLGSCVPEGVAGTATAKIFFLEKTETTRDHDPHNEHFLVLDITTYSKKSTNYDSEADSSPRCILSLGC